MIPAIIFAVLGTCLLLYVLNDRKPGTNADAMMFLNKMIHKTHYENIRFVNFCIDCYKFDFLPYQPDGLDTKIQYDFLDYIRYLDLSDLKSIVIMYIWFVQHGVKFKIKYHYSRQLPLFYNLRQMTAPGKMRRAMLCVDMRDIMAFNLDCVKGGT